MPTPNSLSQLPPSVPPPTRPPHTRSSSSPSAFLALIFGCRPSPDVLPRSCPCPSDGNPASDLQTSLGTQRRFLRRYSSYFLEKMQEDDELSNVSGQSAEKTTSSQNGWRSSEYSHLPCSPQPPSRQPSYSRRHASFNSPREVPLPSPSSNISSQLTGYPFPVTAPQASRVTPAASKNSNFDTTETLPSSASHCQTLENDDHASDSDDSALIVSRFPTPTNTLPDTPTTNFVTAESSAMVQPADGPNSHRSGTPNPSPATDHHHVSSLHETGTSQTTPIFPFARPYSLPDSHTKTYGSSASHAGPSSQAGNWIDRSSTASLPLPSQTPYNLLPRMSAGPSAEGPSLRSSGLQNPPVDTSERRPLPTPPSVSAVPADIPPKPAMTQHSRTPSQSTWASQAIPSSPPPPYSRFLAPEDPVPSTRALSRSTSSASTMPGPEAPVILAPPTQSDGASDDGHRRAPYDSFLCHAPPPDTWIAVETSQIEYSLVVRLPGFRRDGITIATRRRRILHVVADSWEPGGGHFERRVSFGYDADLTQVRAEFDGEMLRIIIPRRPSAVSWYNP
ncbi:hypothetical protein HYDPIDRAFT_107782 [Hydnomerulius pinastri MD-312]|nr:hypothetical protein HYDPIDRAFT_107782 [Hydnomerulius pinastri MD-312]